MVRSRRRLWLVGMVVAALAAGLAALELGRGDEPARRPARLRPAPLPADQRFRSRPDLRPPAMTVTTLGPGTVRGLVFLAPKRSSGPGGPVILDERGRLVWFHPTPEGVVADDFRVQRYRGRPVLTWWEGRTVPRRGYGRGTWVIADRSYREVARVRAGRGLHGDLHEMQLTARGTALIAIYAPVDADLPGGGQVMDSVIQEVEVRSGKVLWEWRSLDHVALGETFVGRPRDRRIPFDYFHINSIEEDDDGGLLVSARNTWAIYKIARPSGDVVWRLGGRGSDFALGEGVRFAWQHDARRMPDGTITLFDNQATPKVGEQSRALVLDVDERRRTATLARELTHPDRVLAFAEGNAQALPGGGMMVGWGLGRRVSELGPDGALLFDVELASDTDTYRAFRFAWTGRPSDRPRLALERSGDRVTVYASWNAATGVTRWELLGGNVRNSLRRIAVVDRSGFETAIEADTTARWLAVRALVGERQLATSAAVRGG